MARDRGQLRASEGLPQPSTFSSARSDYGSSGGSDFEHDPRHMTAAGGASYGGGASGGYPAPVPAHGGVPSLGVGQPRVALHPSVKLPPSMMSGYQPRQHPHHPV